MTRIKRGILSVKKRRKTLKYTKGFRWSRKSKKRAAKEALLHAWHRSFRGRKEKKRDFRALWNTRINAALRNEGEKYSSFIALLRKKNIKLDRKILADFAKNEPQLFKKIIAFSRKA